MTPLNLANLHTFLTVVRTGGVRQSPLCITHRPGHMLITDIPEMAGVPVLAPEAA